jgi:hypothetical protein
MAQKIKQGNIFGRIGTGVGKGLAEQLPKEIERGRLASGLKELGNQKGLTPFQQFSSLASLPGVTPQMIQSGSDLLRQQAIIDSINGSNKMPSMPSTYKPFQEQGQGGSATTTESTEAALNPYIPPSGPEQEDMARRLLASEPQIYRDIESARAAIASQVAGNVQQSNAKLAKRELEESVQGRAEQKLRDEIKTVGAAIPGTVLSNLQQQAVDDVTTKKLSPDAAKVKYGQKADAISRDFANIRSWGNLGLITKNPKDLLTSINGLHSKAKEGGYQKEAADALIAENGLSPQFAYANMYPVSDIKPLSQELKSLPNIQPRLEKAPGLPGLAGVGRARPKNANAPKLTLEAAPRLARAMGPEGSPLSISYELDKKGYDPQIWKQYLLDNQKQLNLTLNQMDELEKPQPSFFGWLNDLWLRSFSGVK